MEDVLEVYTRPYDPQRPLVCLDETSRQLLGQVTPPMPLAPGQPAREDYEYVRQGVCNLMFGLARTVILVGLPVFTVQVLEAPAWLAGALYATYTAMIAFGQTSVVRQLEGHRRTRALMLAAILWAMSFLLLAAASLLPAVVLAGFLFGVTGLYTVAVMLHAGVIDALVVEAAPDRLRARYVGVYHLSWAVANALAPGLFAFLLAWQPILPRLALTLLLLFAAVGVWVLEVRLTQAAVRPTAMMSG